MLNNVNCIIKVFENNNLEIFKEDINDREFYYFKASDVGKILGISNIRTSIKNFNDDEKVIRKGVDKKGVEQDTIFLTSVGVYKILYNNKKGKQFRKWVSRVLDDVIFNQGKVLKEYITRYEILQLENEILKNQLKNQLNNNLDENVSEELFPLELENIDNYVIEKKERKDPKEYQREYREKNREKYNTYQKEYQAKKKIVK